MMILGRVVRRPPLASSAHQARAFASGHSSKFRAEEMGLEGDGNAYQVLGVSPTCNQDCIRDAFRKLAKLTHPDMQSGLPSPPSSAHFIVVLSAYQILSNPEKRARYDAYLQECLKSGEKSHNPEIKRNINLVNRDMEVVQWLRWYRSMAMTMIHQHEIGTGKRFHDEFRANLHEALKRAYFGPHLYDDDALPDCFEAEERAEATELEVLHLVSGCNLIGAVLQVGPAGLLKEGMPKLVPLCHSQLGQSSPPSFMGVVDTSYQNKVTALQESGKLTEHKLRGPEDRDQSAFVDLELYLFGNLVARATREHSKSGDGSVLHVDRMDEITVYLCGDQFPRDHKTDKEDESGENLQDVLLGTILGLNTTEFGGKGRVYSPSGEQTHVIWQFRTPWVKHMHWFKINGKRMLCECRSTRACLPSSKFWVFEPRCGKHNIGGWYIESLWRNGSTEAEGPNNWAGKQLGLLHPAMYILGTAYKTLDTEAIKRRRKSLWSMMWDQQTLLAVASRALQWCKTRLPFIN